MYVGLWLLSGCTSTGAQTGMLDELLERATVADVSGIYIAEIHADRIVNHSAGVLSLEKPAPINGSSRIRIASLGKLYGSALVASYVLDGQLDLDESVAPWLQGTGLFAGRQAQQITWRMLLDQTSGIENYTDLAAWREKKFVTAPESAWSRSQIYRLLQDYPLRFAPGSRWSYSNSNALLLADALENKTGIPYGQQLAQRVYPLANITGTGIDDGRYDNDWVHGYFGTAPRRATLRWRHGFHDAGLTSSLSELARFLQFLYFDPDSVAAYLREQWMTCQLEKATPDGGAYCLGMNRQSLAADTVYFYIEGNWPGYHSSSFFFPASGRALLIFTATTSRQADGWHDRLEDYFLKQEAIKAGGKPGSYGQSP